MRGRSLIVLFSTAVAASSCLSWYAPGLSSSEGPHEGLEARAPNDICMSCHIALPDPTARTLGEEGTHIEHRGVDPQGARGVDMHAERTSDSGVRGNDTAGLWFPAWMLKEERSCTDCHSIH